MATVEQFNDNNEEHEGEPHTFGCYSWCSRFLQLLQWKEADNFESTMPFYDQTTILYLMLVIYFSSKRPFM